MRFLHTADWHLGRSFSGFTGEQRKELRRGRMETLRRLFAHAREREIRLMLVAGDQIDSGDAKADSVLTELLSLIAGYPEIEVVMITGNHDPSAPLGIFNRIDPQLYPENLRFVAAEETLELGEGAVLFAASLQAKNGTGNPLAWIPPRQDESQLRIGMAHGSLAIPGRHKSDDFPIPPSFAAEAGLDYLALGHWHSQYLHDECTAYPGTHEPLGFGERSGALEVELSAPGESPVVKPVELPPSFHWRSEGRELGGSLPEWLLELLRGGSSGEILRLQVSGELRVEEQEKLRKAMELAAGNRFAFFPDDRTRVAGDAEELAGTEGIGYLAEVIRRIGAGETVPLSGGPWGEPSAEEVRDAALRRIHDFLQREELR